MSTASLTRDNLRGGILMTIAMFVFAIEDALVKLLAGEMPIGEVVLIVGSAAVVMMWVTALLARAPLLSRDLLQGPILLRNIGELIGSISFLVALVMLPLSMASALFQTLPLAITAGAALFLGETVGWRRWLAVAVGFTGVIVILRPTGAGFVPLAAAASMLSVLALAGRDLATRRIRGNIHSLSVAFWGVATYWFSGPVLLVAGGQPMVMPDLRQLLLLALTTALSLIGYYLMILATRIGEVSAIMPFRYTRLVFAIILGAILFAERLDLWMWLGSAMIVGAGVYAFVRERYHAIRAQRLSITRQKR